MTADIAFLAPLVVLAVSLLLVGLFLVRRTRPHQVHDGAGAVADGLVRIPVIATFLGLRWLSPWIALAANSLNPSLSLGPGGMEYRVLRRRYVSYAAVESVEVRTALGTMNLNFVFRDTAVTFTANVGDKAAARTALRRLPPYVPRSNRARRLEQSPPSQG